jgi:ATPase subunit of ABC transporter with duplicated ATPase domains
MSNSRLLAPIRLHRRPTQCPAGTRCVLLSCSDLGKQFGELTLFAGLSDRTGLVGPNGSGRTTLLELLAWNEAPDAGRRARAPGKQTRLAYVPQGSLFGPDDRVCSMLETALLYLSLLQFAVFRFFSLRGTGY